MGGIGPLETVVLNMTLTRGYSEQPPARERERERERDVYIHIHI